MNIFQFGGGGKGKFPATVVRSLWVTDHDVDQEHFPLSPENVQGSALSVCAFIFKDSNVSLGLWFRGETLFLENTRFSFYVG